MENFINQNPSKDLNQQKVFQTKSINESQNMQNTILNIQILDLSSEILFNLSQQLKNKQLNSTIKICFDSSILDIKQELIIELAKVLYQNIQIQKLGIINTTNECNNNYILEFLKQMNEQQIKQLKLNFCNVQVSPKQSEQINKIITNFQNLSTLKINLSEIQVPQPFFNIIELQLKHLQTLKIKLRQTQLDAQATQQLVNSIIKQNQLQKLQLDLILSSVNQSNLQKIPVFLSNLEYFTLILQNQSQYVEEKHQEIHNETEEKFQRKIKYLKIEEQIQANKNINFSNLLGLQILNSYSIVTSLSIDLTQYNEQNLYKYIQQVSRFDQLHQLNMKLNNSQLNDKIICHYKQSFENLKELNDLSLIINSQKFFVKQYSFSSLIRHSPYISKLRLKLKIIQLTDDLYQELFGVLPSLKYLKQIYFIFGKGYSFQFNYKIFLSNVRKCSNLNYASLSFQNLSSSQKSLKQKTDIILQSESLNSQQDTIEEIQTKKKNSLASKIQASMSSMEAFYKIRIQQLLQQNLIFKKAIRLVKLEVQ
ncbi:hypothetical protein TTHERM_01396400 (macronuclear) [Tetrahymena thermophila SB210]|uniref:Kinase domain protein n=1 Tax=Tetrahymena thermophila (strain SB210) TaxID=312017 RepID=Q22R28_TETTS|nr:hypothetical protein TTHERM_01396400 [Tetrahymena thermophila SB210]EAR87733.2 hypothetical protein TTHERM_01396400 [Tetrahymena thermophila SB210]|eukprot:XP_001007978.2 hypothetical protein TTHERM_01396400 [Tetrahymena thermophila SB210]